MKNLEEDIVPFEVAEYAKEKGYSQEIDKEVWSFRDAYHKSGLDWGLSSNMDEYDDHVKKMTRAQLRRWLQKEHGVILWITPYKFSSAGGWAYNLQVWDNGTLKTEYTQKANGIDHSYEEAYDLGLQQALHFINNNTEE